MAQTAFAFLRKLWPELGDGIKLENEKLTLPACSKSAIDPIEIDSTIDRQLTYKVKVRQDSLNIEAPVLRWALTVVIIG